MKTITKEQWEKASEHKCNVLHKTHTSVCGSCGFYETKEQAVKKVKQYEELKKQRSDA